MASLVEAAGNVLDLPASMIRDALVLRNPIDQLLSPLGQDNRTSGNEMLNMIGLEGDSPWLGLGLEMALDPTTYLGWGALSKGAKGYAAASKALKAAGKKAGVTGVARDLLSPAAKKLDDLRAARKARAGSRASQGLDTQLSGIEKRIAELEAQGQLPAGAAAQATAGVQAAAGARTIDEAAQIINAIPDPTARQTAMQALSEIQDAQTRVQGVASRFTSATPPLNYEQSSGWIGKYLQDTIGNSSGDEFVDAKILESLTSTNTGVRRVANQAADVARPAAASVPSPVADEPWWRSYATDAENDSMWRLRQQNATRPAAPPVPDTAAMMNALTGDATQYATARGGPPLPATYAVPSRMANAADAAGTLMETLVSPGMVDMDELAKLIGSKKPPPPPATRGLSAADAHKLEMLRKRRQTILGTDAAGRRQYLDAANAIREQPIPELMGRRLPTIEYIRNATYRDPRFRQVFGGGGAILAADEGRSGNPYDPYAADEMGMEPDELMRAMMAYRGR